MTARQEEWRSALATCAKTREALCRDVCAAIARPALRGVLKPGEPARCPEMSNMEAPSSSTGEFGGVFTRCGMNNVIGEWTHRLNMGCLVVR